MIVVFKVAYFRISANQLDMDARAFVLKSSCWVLCAVEALATILNAIVGLCGRGVALSEFGSVFPSQFIARCCAPVMMGAR